MNDKEVVAAVLSKLAAKLGSDRFDVWFGAKVRIAAGDSIITVEVPNQFHQSWLRRHFRSDVEAACQEALGRAVCVEFRVNAALDRNRTANQPRREDPQRTFCFEGEAEIAVEHHSGTTAVLEQCDKQRNDLPPAASPGRKYAALASFVVGPNNRLAHAAASMVAERLGQVNPLFIYGGTGVGKTHLLEGLFSAVRRRQRNVNALFLTAEQFTTGFLEALRGGGLASYRQKYRNVDLLILDDLQFFVGKRATVIEFLSTLDALVRQGRQLVVAADRAPAELTELGPELMARLSAGLVLKIDPADYATRLGIVRQRAHALGLEIDAGVCEFLAAQLTGHSRQLLGALNRLLAASRIRGGRISQDVADEALSDIIQQHAMPVGLKQIERAVCEAFGLGPESLQGTRRAKALNAPRMLAMFLARKHTHAALSEIGQHFGRRSHSTVIAARKSVDHWLAEPTELQIAGKTYTAQEAVRRVEAKLKTG